MEIQTMALTLTRNLGEKLLIGDDITVEVRGVKGNQVQLAITAPRHVEIDREEIRKRKNRERGSQGYQPQAFN